MPDMDDNEARPGDKKRTAIIILSVVGLVLLAGVFLSAIRWVLGILVLAGIGYGIWLLVGPKLTGFFTRRREAKEQHRAHTEAQRAAASRQQNIESELDAIKKGMKQQ